MNTGNETTQELRTINGENDVDNIANAMSETIGSGGGSGSGSGSGSDSSDDIHDIYGWSSIDVYVDPLDRQKYKFSCRCFATAIVKKTPDGYYYDGNVNIHYSIMANSYTRDEMNEEQRIVPVTYSTYGGAIDDNQTFIPGSVISSQKIFQGETRSSKESTSQNVDIHLSTLFKVDVVNDAISFDVTVGGFTATI